MTHYLPYLILLFTLLTPAVLCIRMNNQFYASVILEFGKFKRVQTAGFYFIFPFYRSIEAIIDLRTITSKISTESALTSNGVPLNINLVFQWQVLDAEKAVMEIEDYRSALFSVAHTSLRESIGKNTLEGLLQNRSDFSEALKNELAEKITEWGIQITSVQILDISVPETIQNVMSQQEEASRRSSAQITLAKNEKELAEINKNTGMIYASNPKAWEIRQLDALITIAKTGNPILIPSNLQDTLAPATAAAITQAMHNAE